MRSRCLFAAAQPGTAGIPLHQPTQSPITSQSPCSQPADPVLPWLLASDDPMQAYEAVDAGSAAWSPQEHDACSNHCCDEISDLTCAVCLNVPEPVDLAIVKGCEHQYCVSCILHWAMYKETPLCPQCKAPFHYLYVHRQLDGTVSDYPLEESVVLLKRASWFTEHLKVLDKGKKLGAADAGEAAGPSGVAPVGSSDYYLYEEDEDEYYDDDDEFEQYYFSSAAGRARVVIGNRRFGENGFVRGGRRYARPLPQPPQPPTPASASTSASKAGAGPSKAGSGPFKAGAGPSKAGAGSSKGKKGGAGAGSSTGIGAGGSTGAGAEAGSAGAATGGASPEPSLSLGVDGTGCPAGLTQAATGPSGSCSGGGADGMRGRAATREPAAAAEVAAVEAAAAAAAAFKCEPGAGTVTDGVASGDGRGAPGCLANGVGLGGTLGALRVDAGSMVPLETPTGVSGVSSDIAAAVPVLPTTARGKGSGKRGKGAKNQQQQAQAQQAGEAGAGSSGCGGGGGGRSGRRANRTARRTAADLAADLEEAYLDDY